MTPEGPLHDPAAHMLRVAWARFWGHENLVSFCRKQRHLPVVQNHWQDHPSDTKNRKVLTNPLWAAGGDEGVFEWGSVSG